MNLAEISWPVFKLGSTRPEEKLGCTFYYSEYENKRTSTIRKRLRIVDDLSVEGETLAIRRLEMLKNELPLYPIRNTIYFLADLVKIAKAPSWFIDSNGKLFQYKKTTRAKLAFYKIKRILPGTGMGAVIEVEGLVQRFKCMYRPRPEQHYVGILKWGLGYLLYGFYEEKLKESYRLV